MPRLALLLVCVSTPAFAQGNLQLDEFHPAVDSRGYLTLNGSQVLDRGDVSFGLGSLEWGRHLLAMDGTSVDNMISATLVGAVGLRLGDVPFELGASLPFTIMNGTDPSGQLVGQGVGDLGLHAKIRLLHAGPFGLGVLGSVYLPTANDRFFGEAGVTPQATAIADLSLGRLRLAVNGGVRLRPTSSLMSMGGQMVETSTELPLGAAAAYALVPQKFEVVGEVFGAVPLGDHHGYESLEAIAGVKLYLAKNSYLSLGAGRGLAPDQAGNPDLRAFIGIVFEPKSADRTAAYIPDAEDPPPPPPKVAKNDFPDRDNDGIRDDLDKCPDEPENYNGYQDQDGCPDDPPPVIDVGSQLEVLRPIEFEFDKAVLRPSASEILDAVVKMMKDNPAIELVEVQGHTDEQGPDDYNLDLSIRRAAAVMAYLADHGIAASRLESHGYGETMPIDRHHNQEAYTKNRRVEFHVLKRSDL